jgi:hypothetical protein
VPTGAQGLRPGCVASTFSLGAERSHSPEGTRTGQAARRAHHTRHKHCSENERNQLSGKGLKVRPQRKEESKFKVGRWATLKAPRRFGVLRAVRRSRPCRLERESGVTLQQLKVKASSWSRSSFYLRALKRLASRELRGGLQA